MDIQQLNAIDTTNPEEVKGLQTFLRSRGYYNGPIDGKWGGGTTEGAGRLRADLMEMARASRETAQSNVEAEKLKGQQQREKMAMEAIPYAVGAGGGMAVGHGVNKAIAAKDAALAAEASRIASNPNIDPSIKEAQLAKMNRARFMRNAAQFSLPAVLAAGGYATRNFIAPQFSEQGQRDIVNAIGVGENAGALATGAHQLIGTALRGNPIGNETQAKIMSEALRARRGMAPKPAVESAPAMAAEVTPQVEATTAKAPASPGTPGTQPVAGTKADLVNQARRLGLKGYSKLPKADLATMIQKAVAEHGAKRTVAKRATETAKTTAKAAKTIAKKAGRGAGKISPVIAPLVAGGMAYDAATNDAMAAGEDPTSARLKGTAAGLAAGGGTAAATYGLGRLVDAIRSSQYGPALSRAAGAVGTTMERAAAPSMAFSFVPEVKQSLRESLGPDSALAPYFNSGDTAAPEQNADGNGTDPWASYVDPEVEYNNKMARLRNALRMMEGGY